MTVSEQINKILRDSEDGEFIALHSGQSELYFKAVDLARAHNLIVKRGNVYDLTQTGYEVLEAGSFENWRADSKKRESEAHQATLDSAKATGDSAQFAKSSAKAAWFSGVVGAVAILISLYQLYKGNETDDKLNAVTKRAESTDSLVKVLRQNQTTNEQKGNRVSSDSLVRQVVPGSASRATGGPSQR